MPLYTNAFPPKSIAPGDAEKVWNAEVVVAGGVGAVSASARVALVEPSTGNGTPFSAFIQFSAAPGNFEVDVQCAEEDVDTEYQTVASPGTITAVDATNQTARVYIPENSKFARLYLRSLANASVKVTGIIKR